MTDPDLSITIGSLTLQNPVVTASGTFGYGLEFTPFLDINKLGAITVKGLSLQPRLGNPPPRIVETASGLLNAIGLENIGIEAFIREKLPLFKKIKAAIIVNILGNTLKEYEELTKRINEIEGVDALEVNISCPNVKEGGISFGGSSSSAYEVTSLIKKSSLLPIIVKLTPNNTDIVKIAKSVEEAGADGISMVNTFLGMAIDIKKRRPILANITGGLSGPAIKPIALRMVWQTAQVVKIPIIGMGGIMSPPDALEFLIAGASAVAIGTGNFINPCLSIEIVEGIKNYLIANRMKDVKEIINSLET
ncbi:MAG: dihydroorotate dehydrogenase [bacterium]